MSEEVNLSDFVELPSLPSNEEYFQSLKQFFVSGENLKGPCKNKYHSEWPFFLPESLVCLVPNSKSVFNKIADYFRRMSVNALISLFFTAESFAENQVQIRQTDNTEIQQTLKWEEYIALWTKHYLRYSDSEVKNNIESCRKLFTEVKDLIKRDARTETIRQLTNKPQAIFLSTRSKRDAAMNCERGFPNLNVRDIRRDRKKKVPKTSSFYDETGRLKQVKLDLCDCLELHCPGCAYEKCHLCKSFKCVYNCRNNRKYAPYDYTDEHENFLSKFPVSNQLV